MVWSSGSKGSGLWQRGLFSNGVVADSVSQPPALQDGRVGDIDIEVTRLYTSMNASDRDHYPPVILRS